MTNFFKKISARFKVEGFNSFFIIYASFILKLSRLKYRIFFGWHVSAIVAPATIRGKRHIDLGMNFSSLSNLWIDAISGYKDQNFKPRIIIGDNFSASIALHIAATNYVRIGNNVLVGSKVLITDHVHGIYNGEDQSSPDEAPAQRLLTSNKSVIIEDNVFIGDNSCIMPGVTIGYGSIVAANSVVTADVPARCIVAGCPAVIVREFDLVEKKWKNVKNVVA